MAQYLLDILFVIYVIAGIGLVVYGFNCYWSIYLFLKNSRRVRLADRKNLLRFYRDHKMDELPKVTTQLPVFNEANCVERLIDVVCAIDYPKDKHEIIARRGTACDVVVDAQLRQESIYFFGKENKAVTDVDFEIFGLSPEDTATVRFAFGLSDKKEREETQKTADALCTLKKAAKESAACGERKVLIG